MTLRDSRNAQALLPDVAIARDAIVGEIAEQRSRLEIAAAAVVSDAMRKEVNVAKAILHAEEELKNDQTVPPEQKIDPDWLLRWRDHAGNVSSDELQSLWGRLLAGEVKSPGAYSLRTLEFVKNISGNEANMIATLCGFVIGDNIARSQLPLLEAAGITFGVLLELQDLGVVSGVESIGLNYEYPTNDASSYIKALKSNGRALIIRHPDPKKKFTLQVYVVTVLGRQLARLARSPANEAYLRAIGGEFKSAGATVSIADYVEVTSQIQVLNEQPI